MRKIISLTLALMMVLSLSSVAFAAETYDTTGEYTASVKGNYVEGVEASGIVYSITIEWPEEFNFTYHDAKNPVWDPETLTYSETEEAYWEGEETITVTNRSNTKITATPKYDPADGYGNADVDFSTDELKVASAESGTEQSGTITVTPTGSLPAMEEADTIGTITLTIEQDTDVTLAELKALKNEIDDLISTAIDSGAYAEHEDAFNSLQVARENVGDIIDAMEEGGTWTEEDQQEANYEYEDALEQYELFKKLV